MSNCNANSTHLNSGNKSALDALLAKYNIQEGVKKINRSKELSDEEKKKIAELEQRITDLNHGFSVMINELNSNKEISQSDRIIIEANLKAGHMKEVAATESEIRKINPGWIKNASEKIAYAINTLDEATDVGAEISGVVIGKGVKPVINKVSAFWKGITKGIQ